MAINTLKLYASPEILAKHYEELGIPFDKEAYAASLPEDDGIPKIPVTEDDYDNDGNYRGHLLKENQNKDVV